MYTLQQIQAGMAGEYGEWESRVREAGARYTYSRTITGVQVERGKYIWLYYTPEHGKHQDKGKIDIGSVNSPAANFIAGVCTALVGQRVRLLDSLVEGGGGQKYKRLAWVGDLPPELEQFVTDDNEPDRPWSPPGAPQAPPSTVQQAPAQPMHPQPAPQPVAQPMHPQPAPQQPAQPMQQPPAQSAPVQPPQPPQQQQPPGQFGYGQ